MATNLRNYGVVEGRLAADPKVFENKDGSKKVLVTVYADNNFKGKDGQRGSVAVPLEAFVRADAQGLGAFEYMHKGDTVGFMYHVRVDNFDKGGQSVWETKLVVDSTDLKETKTATQARAAKAAAEQAIAADEEQDPAF